MDFERNEMNKNSKGGTEQMMQRIFSSLPEELLSKYQIIPSRVRDLEEDKLRVYYAHDLAKDPESLNALGKNGSWARFHRIVFVSHWQRQQFMNEFTDLPWSKTQVIQNAISPIPKHSKPTNKINLIYHTTPHRGLNILVPVYKKLSEKYGDKLHLHVYSSFDLYGWKDQDDRFSELFKEIDSHEHMTNHGTVSNDEIREALKTSHIFAYPSIHPETSCLCLIEAMAAGCICVHPDYAALAETAANWTFMYNWHEDMQKHASIFYNALNIAIETTQEAMKSPEKFENLMAPQVSYMNRFHDWDTKAKQWAAFLVSFKDEPVKLEKFYKAFRYTA